MRKLWQNDFGIRGLFRHHPLDEGTAASHLTGKLARYVVDGVPSPVPSDVTVADATHFARDNPNHMAMFLYANPTAEQIEELADA